MEKPEEGQGKRKVQEEWVRRIQQGDFESFAPLVRAYQEWISWKAKGLQGAEDPEDLIQEGYMGLFLAAKSYRWDKGVPFQGYARVCIKNHMISAIRRDRGKETIPPQRRISLTAEPILDEGQNPESAMELKQDFQQLISDIQENFSDLEYRVLRIRLSNLCRMQIPVETGISLRSYDNALLRVRKKLRILSGRGL